MRKLTPYLLVAAVAAVITWFAAVRRHDYELPAAPQEPPINMEELTPEERNAVTVYRDVNRSVVHINTRTVTTDDTGFGNEAREGSGSGSVLDKNGHIVTNFHVIDGARRIDVLLFDGSSYE